MDVDFDETVQLLERSEDDAQCNAALFGALREQVRERLQLHYNTLQLHYNTLHLPRARRRACGHTLTTL